MPGRFFALVFSIAVLICGTGGTALSDPIVITHNIALAGLGGNDDPGYPVVISSRGSYILQSNLTPPANTLAIEVQGIGVSLDLNGYVISAESASNTHGIIVSGSANRIFGGSIRYFALNCIWIVQPFNVIENMNASFCRANGVDAAGGRNTVIRNSMFAGNTYGGVVVGEQGRIEDSVSANNGATGMLCTSWCHLIGNTITRNGGDGVRAVTGFLVENYIANNTAFGVNDTAAVDLGLANNYLLYNNPNGPKQIVGGLEVHPNRCVGRPC